MFSFILFLYDVRMDGYGREHIRVITWFMQMRGRGFRLGKGEKIETNQWFLQKKYRPQKVECIL